MRAQAGPGDVGRANKLLVAGVIILVGMIAVTVSAPAAAHAEVGAHAPLDGVLLEAPPATVWVMLSEPVNVSLSSIEIVGTDGQVVPATMSVERGAAQLIASPDMPLGVGGYVVFWEATSAIEGHATDGSWTFTVSTPLPPRPAAFPPGPLAGWLPLDAWWLTFAGLATIVAGVLGTRTATQPTAGVKQEYRGMGRDTTALRIGGALTLLGSLLVAWMSHHEGFPWGPRDAGHGVFLPASLFFGFAVVTGAWAWHAGGGRATTRSRRGLLAVDLAAAAAAGYVIAEGWGATGGVSPNGLMVALCVAGVTLAGATGAWLLRPERTSRWPAQAAVLFVLVVIGAFVAELRPLVPGGEPSAPGAPLLRLAFTAAALAFVTAMGLAFLQRPRAPRPSRPGRITMLVLVALGLVPVAGMALAWPPEPPSGEPQIVALQGPAEGGVVPELRIVDLRAGARAVFELVWLDAERADDGVLDETLGTARATLRMVLETEGRDLVVDAALAPPPDHEPEAPLRLVAEGFFVPTGGLWRGELNYQHPRVFAGTMSVNWEIGPPEGPPGWARWALPG